MNQKLCNRNKMKNRKIAIASYLTPCGLSSSIILIKEDKVVKGRELFIIDNLYKPTLTKHTEHRGKHRKSKYPYIK